MHFASAYLARFKIPDRGPLRSWMVLAINLFQALFYNVRINLRSGDISMPQHHLDCAQIGSAIQQMSRKAVPKHVGLQFFLYSRLLPRIGNHFPTKVSRARPTPSTQKQQRG